MHDVVKMINDERKKQNLSWEKLAKEAGITSAAWRNWRYRGSAPNIETANKVLTALGITYTIGKTK